MGKGNKKSQAVKIEKIRKFRKDKQITKRPRITITEDYGDMERTQIYTMPPEYEREELLIPKEKNPNIVYILQHPIKIVWYSNTHKGFIYTYEGIYLGQYDRSHLKRMYNRIGNILKSLIRSRSKSSFSEKEQEENSVTGMEKKSSEQFSKKERNGFENGKEAF